MSERVIAITKLTETLQILDSDSDVQRAHMPAFFIGHGSPMNAIEDNIVHNLRLIDFRRPEGGFDWAIEADRIVTDKIRNGDHAGLCDYRGLGRAVDMAIPTPDHYLPLLYVLGMQDPRDELTLFNSEPAYGSLTMTSLRLDTEAN
ncbi:MAG: hypothetical protein U0892_19135 [Pirellulales bacterium]